MSSLADSGRDLLSLQSINTTFPDLHPSSSASLRTSALILPSANLRESPRLCVILFFPMNLEEAIIEVWRQVLLEDAKSVTLSSECYPVRTTPKSRLRQVDFVFDGIEMRGLEQNPNTKSRWAQLARSGKKVMQFLSNGQYIANVVDGQLKLYGKK